MTPAPSTDSWSSYLSAFHADRPGITESILGRTSSEGIDPYAWCAEPLQGAHGVVADLACGSGPLVGLIPGWMGLDLSSAELAAARALGRGPLTLASATQAPLASGSAAAVVCSMSMQIIEPLGDALGEMARILRPGARAVLLVPSNRPVPLGDAWIYLRLQLHLRRRIRYPNDRALRGRSLPRACERVGLVVEADERRPFALPLRSPEDAQLLVRSLYLPGVSDGRLRAGAGFLATKIGRDLAVPLRRIVMRRSEAADCAL